MLKTKRELKSKTPTGCDYSLVKDTSPFVFHPPLFPPSPLHTPPSLEMHFNFQTHFFFLHQFPAKVTVARILVWPRALARLKCDVIFSGRFNITRLRRPRLRQDITNLRENEKPKKRHTFNLLSRYQWDCWRELIPVRVMDPSCRHVPGEQINVIGTRVTTLCFEDGPGRCVGGKEAGGQGVVT